MKEFIFTWNIENISYSWHKTGESIDSPLFCASSMHKTTWYLTFYPRGLYDSDYLSLYLHRQKDKVPLDLAVNFELSCVTVDASLHSIFIPETFTAFANGRDCGYGDHCFIKRYEIFDQKKALYLQEDILTLRCRMWKDEDEDDNDNEFGQIFGRTRLMTERIVSVQNVYFENLMRKEFHIHLNNENKALISYNVVYYGDKIDLGINPISEEVKTSIFKLHFVDKRTKIKLCEHVSYFFGRPTSVKFYLPFSEKVLPIENDNSDANNFEIFSEFVYSTGKEVKMIEKDFSIRIPEFFTNYIINWVPSLRQTDCPSVFKDLYNLYKEQILCDVELKTQTESFFVHKVVLCARSRVFLSILTNEMKEKLSNCIEIEDISAGTLEKFIIFLYTDAFKDFEWNTVVELYYTADKYQVERLKFTCYSYFMKNDDFNNICDLVILADKYQDCKLKQKVQEFIWKNEEKIFNSIMWKKFADEQPKLAMKIMLSKYEDKDNECPAYSFDNSITKHSSLLDDLRSLYEDNVISDIVIKTKSNTFPAHKTVLRAFSATFNGMLRTYQISKNIESTDILEIEDLEDDTVSRLLLFLYTDYFEDVQWDTAKKLYHAADKYQIQRLKFITSGFLLQNLNVSNACDLLSFAHGYSNDKFMTSVKDFILLHDDEIFGSDEWFAFAESNFRLAFETMRAKYTK